jgi:L-2,4-diaminobutyrate decarboxylase
VALRAHGRSFLGRAIETTLDLAAGAPWLIENHHSLELARQPSLNTILFRYVPTPAAGPEELDRVNDAIRLSLLHAGRAVIGRTRLDGRVFLKLTLMNPTTTAADLHELLTLVTVAAEERAPLAA